MGTSISMSHRRDPFASKHDNGLLRVVGVLICLLSAANSSQAQREIPQTTIGSDIRCKSCKLRVFRVARLGALEGDGALPGPPAAMVRNSRGHIAVVPDKDPSVIRVFNSSGALIRRVGRRGKGPGEFLRIQALARGPRDTLYVFDAGNRRLAVLAPDYRHVRQVPLDADAYDAVNRSDGTFLINADIRTRDRIGYPLHIIGRDGNVISSFGVDVPVYRGDNPYITKRYVGLSPTGDVWSAYFNQFVIEHVNSRGEIDRRVVRKANWFTPYVRPWSPTPQKAPVSFLTDIRVDQSGMIWAGIAVPRSDYRKFLATKPTVVEGQRVYAIEDPIGMYRSYLEVLDPVRAVVLARVQFEDLFAGWLDEEFFTTYSEQNGVPYLTVWRAELTN